MRNCDQSYLPIIRLASSYRLSMMATLPTAVAAPVTAEASPWPFAISNHHGGGNRSGDAELQLRPHSAAHSEIVPAQRCLHRADICYCRDTYPLTVPGEYPQDIRGALTAITTTKATIAPAQSVGFLSIISYVCAILSLSYADEPGTSCRQRGSRKPCSRQRKPRPGPDNTKLNPASVR